MPRRSVIIRSFAFGNAMIRPRFVMGFTLERFQPLQRRQARIRSLASNTVTTDAWLRLKNNSRLVVRTTCDGMLPRLRQRGFHIRHVGLMPQRRLPSVRHLALGLNLGRSQTCSFRSTSSSFGSNGLINSFLFRSSSLENRDKGALSLFNLREFFWLLKSLLFGRARVHNCRFGGLAPVRLKVFVNRIRAIRRLVVGSFRSIYRHGHVCELWDNVVRP